MICKGVGWCGKGRERGWYFINSKYGYEYEYTNYSTFQIPPSLHEYDLISHGIVDSGRTCSNRYPPEATWPVTVPIRVPSMSILIFLWPWLWLWFWRGFTIRYTLYTVPITRRMVWERSSGIIKSSPDDLEYWVSKGGKKANNPYWYSIILFVCCSSLVSGGDPWSDLE